MDAANEVGYKPPPEFQEDMKDPLIELNLTDSSELWLIQWPINEAPDLDGQELSLKLHHDGLLGSCEGSSGKSYDVVSYSAQDPNATVFLPSASKSKIVGKISRRVSLIHYPEPSELQKQSSSKLVHQRSSATSLTNSSHHFATPTQGNRARSSAGKSAASMRDSRYKSSLSNVEEQSRAPKRKEPTGSRDWSTQDLGRGHSGVTSSGSLEHSNKRKSKKKKYDE